MIHGEWSTNHGAKLVASPSENENFSLKRLKIFGNSYLLIINILYCIYYCFSIIAFKRVVRQTIKSFRLICFAESSVQIRISPAPTFLILFSYRTLACSLYMLLPLL